MKINEIYIEALKKFSDYVTVSEWAQKVGELYPDILENAEKQAQAQKNDTTGLREIAARISSRLSSGGFTNVLIDDSERPRKVKHVSSEEQEIYKVQELIEDVEPLKRQEIINQAKDNLKIFELYRLDEFRNIQKSLKDFFGLDFELDHANALLDNHNKGEHHPDNIQLLLKYHNGKKNNKSWKRFSFAEQESYINDAIKLQSNVADNFQLELNNDILKQLLVRLKLIY